jgi:hypothetical protein
MGRSKRWAAAHNTAKQKLLDGKQIFSTVISRRDPEVLSRGAALRLRVVSRCSTARCRSPDCEGGDDCGVSARRIPMIRVPDELESTLQRRPTSARSAS